LEWTLFLIKFVLYLHQICMQIPQIKKSINVQTALAWLNINFHLRALFLIIRKFLSKIFNQKHISFQINLKFNSISHLMQLSILNTRLQYLINKTYIIIVLNIKKEVMTIVKVVKIVIIINTKEILFNTEYIITIITTI
jgi:hypothetical protein